MIERYTLPEMGAIWSDQSRFELMLRVELAVSRAQARRGRIPKWSPLPATSLRPSISLG